MKPVETDKLAPYDVIAKRVTLYGAAIGVAGAVGSVLIPYFSLWVPASLLGLILTLHVIGIRKRDWLRHPMIPYAIAYLMVATLLGFAITCTRLPADQIDAFMAALASSETHEPDSKTSIALFMYSASTVFCATLIVDVLKLWICPSTTHRETN
ncbi:hypothetical protein U8335_26645 [Roseiconus lacunae]|uniref:hypothetical protein n=1 Tax=Roseiconus lacunae TaxID=2605694 RepID=UPI003084FC95|nr:hypothetical protein U8335_26645 [Stieleria sp. HD01]